VARRGVDQINGDEPARLLVPRLDDQVGDRPGDRIDDNAAHLAARAI
jgi:hypothetical protein